MEPQYYTDIIVYFQSDCILEHTVQADMIIYVSHRLAVLQTLRELIAVSYSVGIWHCLTEVTL